MRLNYKKRKERGKKIKGKDTNRAGKLIPGDTKYIS